MPPTVSRKSDLANLKLLLHSGIDVMTQMPLASEAIHRLLPSFSLSMIKVSEDYVPREHYSEYFDEFSHQLFASQGEHFSMASDDPAAFSNLLRSKVPYGNLVHGGPDFESGAIYQHLFLRNGIHHVLDLAIRDAEGPLAILGIFREKAAPAFSRADVLVAKEIYSSLVHAFRAPELPENFDETDSAILLTNKSGVIEWATPNARLWLEDAFAGSERAALMTENRLPEACRELARRLLRKEDPTLTLVVPGGRIRLRAYGMNPFSSPDLGTRIAISIHLEMHRGLKVHRALQATSLTPQQRRIALLYMKGLRPAEIAKELGIGAETLKSYQKDMYARLEVSSSVELVRALQAQATAVAIDLERHLPRKRRGYLPAPEVLD